MGVARVGRVALMLVVAVGMMPAVALGAGWVMQPIPNPTRNNLLGVSCVSATACIAVGSYSRPAALATAERWNGTSWAIQPTPDPADDQFSQLSGVSCVSASACTAVGSYLGIAGHFVSLAERWNGTSWVIEPTPNPPDALPNLVAGPSLSGVSCVSASLCTAVGSYLGIAGHPVSLAERWNGASWVIQPTPNPAGAFFTGLSGVSCASASACTAVGVYTNSAGNSVPLAERWDGTTWVIEPTTNPPGAQPREDATGLSGVSCVSASACTAVGFYTKSAGEVSLAERWDGTAWAIQTTPNPPGAHFSVLGGVSCVSAGTCTAVGGHYRHNAGHELPLAERWDGAGWAIQTTPNPSGGATPLFNGSGQLNGVSCVSAGTCTAVGGGLVESIGAPSVSIRAPASGARYALGEVVVARYSCRKGAEAIASCTGTIPNGSRIDTTKPGRRRFTVTATSVDGQRASQTVSYTILPSNKFTVSHVRSSADGTFTFSVTVPGPGSLDVLETAWKDNLASAAVLLKPAPDRFVFARKQTQTMGPGTVTVTVTPNQQGRRLIAHPRYRVVLRLWVSYTPDRGSYRTIGFLGLHVRGSCAKHNTVTALKWRTVVRCN